MNMHDVIDAFLNALAAEGLSTDEGDEILSTVTPETSEIEFEVTGPPYNDEEHLLGFRDQVRAAFRAAGFQPVQLTKELQGSDDWQTTGLSATFDYGVSKWHGDDSVDWDEMMAKPTVAFYRS